MGGVGKFIVKELFIEEYIFRILRLLFLVRIKTQIVHAPHTINPPGYFPPLFFVWGDPNFWSFYFFGGFGVRGLIEFFFIVLGWSFGARGAPPPVIPPNKDFENKGGRFLCPGGSWGILGLCHDP